MPAARITDVGSALGAAPASGDLFPIVDVSDTSQSAEGTTKRVTMANVIDAVEANANTFTAAQTIASAAASLLNLTRAGSSPLITFSDGTNTGQIGMSNGGGVFFVGGTFRSTADDTYDLGAIANRWDDVYATNATIQTSDANLKTDVVDSDLGWDFIRALRPVRYRWAAQTVIDPETGEESIKPAGTRPHYGLIAQEVKAVMDAQGVTDWAGYIYDEESGRHGLRYNELWGPLIAAVQAGADAIEALQAQVAALEARVAALEGA